MQRIKKIFKIVKNEFIFGGHLLSLGGASIAYTASILLNIEITWDFLLIVYLAFQSAYLFNRYKEIEKDSLTNPERTVHLEKYYKKIPFIILLFLLIFFLIQLYFHKIPALIFSSFVVVLGFLYSIFFKTLTRKIIALKDIFVSLLWALVIVFFTLYYSHPLDLSIFILFVFIFLRWIVNTSFFDIKDIKSDSEEHLLTLAVVLGKERLISLLSLITIFAILPIIFGIYLNIIPMISVFLLLTVPYTYYYLKLSRSAKINTAFLYNVIVDGEFLLWPIFILIGKLLYGRI